MSNSVEFMNAIKLGNVEKVRQMLIEKKYDFNANVDFYNADVLTNAFNYNHIEIFKFLLEYGAPLDKGDTVSNSLNRAIQLDDASLVNEVIKKGIDPNKFWASSFSLFAARYKSFDVIMTLLDNGANLNVKTTAGENFLHMMVSRGDMRIIDRLLKSTIDKNVISNNGFTPIIVTMYEENFELAKYLYENGCTTITTDKKNVLTMCKDMEMTHYFLERGAQVNKMNDKGNTPLLAAAKVNNLEMVMLMIERGADPNLFGPTQNSPVYQAIKNKNPEMVRFLLENSADATKSGIDGKSAIDIAFESDDPKIISIFEELYPSKYDDLKGLMCFDEIEHSEFPIVTFMKSPNNIVIKNGDNFKGYSRKDIVDFLTRKGTFYSQEKISKDDIQHLRNPKVRFFELINTGCPISILIPYSDEVFISKYKA